MQQTLSQQRAAKALKLLSEIKQKGKEREEFTQFCKSFPTMVLQNGLGQALAFIKAKTKKKNGDVVDNRYENMYQTLNAWLIHIGLIKSNMLIEINEMDSREYMATQAESLKFLEWIKRYETAGIF